MKCPNCGMDNNVVINSRQRNGNRQWRRRECLYCGYRFSTNETYMPREKIVAKMVKK